MAIIRTLHNFLGKKLYPKTVTKAIYDLDGNRLDVKLEEIDGKLVDVDNKIANINNSLNDVSSSLEWVQIGSATGVTSIPIDTSKYKEFAVKVTCKEINSYNFHLIKNMLSTETNYFYTGSYAYGEYKAQISIAATIYSIELYLAHINGINEKDNCKITVYGR